MSTLSARRKAMRGTKRTCLACEVRFYDLARSPIACPSCGAPYTPAPEQSVQTRTGVASFSTRTGWRNQPFKRPQPAPQVAGPADSAGSESAPAGDGPGDATDEAPEDDLVLEHEQDDADAPGLIDPESTESTGSDEH
jgi:uncharacterized protein (TIGR02300 family)